MTICRLARGARTRSLARGALGVCLGACLTGGVAPAHAVGQSPSAPEPPAPACRDTVISGRVERGDRFEASLPGGLRLVLDPDLQPSSPPGWTIRITPPDAPDHDFSMVATPPYRFSNPRYVDTGYGIDPDRALAWTPRRFGFVASEHDYETAREALGVLLWSGTHTDEEVSRAQAMMDGLTEYDGALFIEDGATVAVDSLPPYGAIRWMRFRVELCVPEGSDR